MLCALCGEVPEEPVVSRKTGAVFEKRLILKYIEENGGVAALKMASLDEVASFQQASYSDLSVSQASSLDVQANYAAIGGFDGKVDIYSIEENNVERSLDIGEPVTTTV
ncbi:hypothetical protein QBC38DRAFT_505691 [Podospora fimiseda]|uniref:Pre-mRNA-processing factor 19 n=1 Tax=Podospora fimiseda TaxID=252190 RepID=A0AAN6YKP1_9PEZI|nr:hypothetical protein QBC38DRAFT_505691 [Podospora fimiseda]